LSDSHQRPDKGLIPPEDRVSPGMGSKIVRILRRLGKLEVPALQGELKVHALLTYPEQIDTYLYKEEDLSLSPRMTERH
jgi:hypothetical protein